MTDILPGKETQAKARFCPKCGSPLVTGPEQTMLTSDASDKFTCGSCNWTGTRIELVVAGFSHSFGSDTDLYQALMNDLRKILAAQAGTAFLEFLVKWGFLTLPVQKEDLGKYLMAIAESSLSAVIATRVEEEKSRGN